MDQITELIKTHIKTNHQQYTISQSILYGDNTIKLRLLENNNKHDIYIYIIYPTIFIHTEMNYTLDQSCSIDINDPNCLTEINNLLTRILYTVQNLNVHRI